MKKDTPIPNVPLYADLKHSGVQCIGIAGTANGLALARKKGLIIFEPRLNCSVAEYNEICKRRKKFFK